jgi:type VI secretion system protein VasG
MAGVVLHQLIENKLQRLGTHLLQRKLAFSHAEELVAHMAERCSHSERGARFVDQWVETNLLPQVVDRLLDAMAVGKSLQFAHARLDPNGNVLCEFS